MKISTHYNTEIPFLNPNTTYIKESTYAASHAQYRSDKFNWLAPIFPLHAARSYWLMFTIQPPLQIHNEQISLISRVPKCNPTAVFSTRVPSQQYTGWCVSGSDCSDIQLRSWNLSTQLDKDKSRVILLPLPLHLYDHYEKEIFWLWDALLSAPDYRCLLAFSHPDLICISDLLNCVSLKSEQARRCQRWVDISTTKIPPQKTVHFLRYTSPSIFLGLGCSYRWQTQRCTQIM